jgi:sialate O-acetylesterase
MKHKSLPLIIILLALCQLPMRANDAAAAAKTLKVHSIFSSNMVIQRNKPIKVWGWCKAGDAVSVTLGDDKKDCVAGDDGLWEAMFDAREASAEPMMLKVVSGEQSVVMDNIVVGDVWVMNGQSNMAFGLGKVLCVDMESAQSDLPLLRLFSIDPNEQIGAQKDIPLEKIPGGGWLVSSPRTCRDFSAIGYVFGSQLQRALGIPIGVIKNARGGASIESLVPEHKFEEDPIAKRYAESVRQRMSEFDLEATAKEQFERELARMKSKGVPEDQWPTGPAPEEVRSWSIPGKSPSDMASCYNGMFGVFKGYNIKGVLFHQGFNNAISKNCRPKRYRILMRLMVEGWREDFQDPALPVGIIGFCAGGDPQHEYNFEAVAGRGGPYVRESQRLGLADVGDPENTAFLPAYDVQIPGLHPKKKQEHGLRAARWALKQVYDMNINWDRAELVSAERQGDTMVLTFDKPVMPDNMSSIPEGFSIADESGNFYRAFARYPVKQDAKQTKNAGGFDTTTIYVWSPLVKEPVGVRYAWGTSPMGNLKVTGKPWAPLHSFRTDSWDYPESDDPTVSAMGKLESRADDEARNARLIERLEKEASMAVEILERLKTLGHMTEPMPDDK